MKLSPIIFLSLLIFTGTSKNHTSTEDFSKVLVPVNDEEEEEKEEASSEKMAMLRPIVHEIYVDKDISGHQPEDSGDDKDALKLHNSLKNLREYLEMLNRDKNQEESISKENPVEDNELGPHYHTMYTNEPSMETLPEELEDQENVGDNPPKDVYFQPIPISDKINMVERNIEVGAGGGRQIRETVLLAVSSATLAILLLLTVFCAAAVYYCSKPYRYLDDYSLTSSEKRGLCPSGSSSYTRTEDSCLLWNEREMNRAKARGYAELEFSGYVDEISTFSDESARTAERDKTEAQPCGLAATSSVPPPAQAVPPSAPPPAQAAPPAPVPAEVVPPAPAPAQEAAPAPAPAQEAPPAPPPAEGVPPVPAPPPPEGAPPEPPPAEGAPPEPPPAEAPPSEAPPPDSTPPPV